MHHNDDDHADNFPLNEEEELAMGNAWNDWCEARIPSEWMVNHRLSQFCCSQDPTERTIELVASADEAHSLRNADGLPVLGDVDLEQIAPAVLTKVLTDFLRALWCKLACSPCFETFTDRNL